MSYTVHFYHPRTAATLQSAGMELLFMGATALHLYSARTFTINLKGAVGGHAPYTHNLHSSKVGLSTAATPCRPENPRFGIMKL